MMLGVVSGGDNDGLEQPPFCGLVNKTENDRTVESFSNEAYFGAPLMMMMMMMILPSMFRTPTNEGFGP